MTDYLRHQCFCIAICVIDPSAAFPVFFVWFLVDFGFLGASCLIPPASWPAETFTFYFWTPGFFTSIFHSTTSFFVAIGFYLITFGPPSSPILTVAHRGLNLNKDGLAGLDQYSLTIWYFRSYRLPPSVHLLCHLEIDFLGLKVCVSGHYYDVINDDKLLCYIVAHWHSNQLVDITFLDSGDRRRRSSSWRILRRRQWSRLL